MDRWGQRDLTTRSLRGGGDRGPRWLADRCRLQPSGGRSNERCVFHRPDGRNCSGKAMGSVIASPGSPIVLILSMKSPGCSPFSAAGEFSWTATIFPISIDQTSRCIFWAGRSSRPSRHLPVAQSGRPRAGSAATDRHFDRLVHVLYQLRPAIRDSPSTGSPLTAMISSPPLKSAEAATESSRKGFSLANRKVDGEAMPTFARRPEPCRGDRLIGSTSPVSARRT